jgi:hypothetical protein
MALEIASESIGKTLMQTIKHLFITALVALAVSGCGTSTGPGQLTDGSSDAPIGARCMLPNGTFCPASMSCPAGDNCNTCSCPPGGGVAACTRLACPPNEGRPCSAGSPCANGTECVFPEAMCGASGICQALSDCAEIQTYCGCDGQPFTSCPGRPTRPNVFRGPCGGADAGR